MTPTPHRQPPAASRHRAVWLVLAFFLVGLGAPCVHCLTLAAGASAASPPRLVAALVVAAPEAEDGMEGMPADCPMHAAHARPAAKTAPAAPVEAPAEAPSPCPKPGDCCLEQGKGPAATLDQAAASPAPALAADTVSSPAAPALPAPLLLPRELGNDRSHAPPAFNPPLRN